MMNGTALLTRKLSLAQDVLEALTAVLGQAPNAALHEPFFAGREWEYVKDCLDTGWVSSVGKYVEHFEVMLQEFTGVKRAVAVVNGTAALHMALLLAGVKTGDEVVMPALTFAATANATAYIGAVPHFTDCEERTLGLDPAKLAAHLDDIAEKREGGVFNRQTSRRLAAVVPMHTFGHPVDLDPLVALCEKWSLPLVEDSAESLGSWYKGKHTGRFGKLGILSFNGNKTVTCGGGGAILTDDEELGRLAKHLTTTAKVPHKWEYFHDQVGYNYRLPNLNAALGCAQLELLPDFLERKRALAEAYRQALESVAGVTFVTEPEGCVSNYWLNALLLDAEDMALREEVLGKINAANIMTRPAWTLMHKLPMYAACPRMALPVSESLEKRIINIPSGAKLYGKGR